jgi:hypothetical protein
MPCGGVSIQILDESLAPVPEGLVGEVYVSGRQMARGYLHDPRLTAASFVADPRGNGTRMFRTGDLGRWTSDGELVVVGRVDGEAKVRGHRVHVAEVEAALEQHKAVAMALVAPVMTTEGQTLNAYIKTRTTADRLTARSLREHLSTIVPAHMIPARFYTLVGERMPALASGKIDRAAVIDRHRGAELPATERDIPAAGALTPTEEIVADVWRRVLNVDDLNRDEGFLDAGGDSLGAITAALQIEDVCAARISVDLLLSNQSLESICRLIELQTDRREDREPIRERGGSA